MPSDVASVLCNKKLEPSVEAEPTTESSPPPTKKRRKSERPQRHREPPFFWDNLSRHWLTSRALREFDRRTVWPVAPMTSDCTSKEEIDLAQLKRFARHGGPHLDNLRGYPEYDTAARANQSVTFMKGQFGISMARSAYDQNVVQHLKDHGVYAEPRTGNEKKPDNWEEIRARLAMRRASLSPSRFTDEDVWDLFDKRKEAYNESTFDEGMIMSSYLPIIAGTADIPSQANVQFENLEDLTDGSITNAQPDFWDGSSPEELNKHFREKLGPYIVPSADIDTPCLPNFFTEVTGPNEHDFAADRQNLHSGALGARGIHELRSYLGQETLYDNKAYTIAVSYAISCGYFEFHTIHPIPSTNPNRKYDFRLTWLGSFSIDYFPDKVREGMTAFRNARDWAKEKREELIAAANGKVPYGGLSGLLLST